jgi:amidohydrolase
VVSGLEGIVGALDGHLDELVAFRRELHMHPELSWCEHETTERLATRLRTAGLDPRTLSSGTGLLCDVGSGDGPVVVLRADIDALALEDEKDVPYRSQVEGVAHACGHDVHTAAVLGAGLAWARAGMPGRLRLVFEPAEETVPGGAPGAIEDGALADAAAIYALHCDPRFDAGSVAVRTGPATAAADYLSLTLLGPGGHTARPDETVDLVALAGRVANEVPARVRERAADLGALRVVFGSLHAGHAANVIPTHATLRGSVRTPEPGAWSAAPAIVRDAVAEVCAGTGADFEIDYAAGVPPVVNDAGAVDVVRRAATVVLGDGAVAEAPRSEGGDSFGWFCEQVPGCYVRLGVHDPAGGAARVDLHAATFDVDERSIGVGASVLLGAAYLTLTSGTK